MTEPSEKANESKSEVQEGTERDFGALVGLLFYVILGLFVVWNNEAAQDLLIRNRTPIIVSVTTVILLALVASVRKGGLTASAKRQIGLILFVGVPVVLALFAAVLLVPDRYQILLLRSLFLLIVCLLPATMYYLFIFSRKSSLLQEYFANLSRLGLLRRQQRGGKGKDVSPDLHESEMVRRTRVMSYIQKFEAVYGPIPAELAGDILDATDPDTPNPRVPPFHRYSSAGALKEIFTLDTTIPVVLATLLIGLGWLLTLPPLEFVDFDPKADAGALLTRVLQPGKVPVHFAFLGAYFFSLQMLFRRYVRKDLRANAYISVSLRIILALIGTWAVLEASRLVDIPASPPEGESKALLVLAFVIGAFPPIAWQVIQAAVRTLSGAKFFVPSLSSEMPVSELQGLTVWHEARLEEEDIENVPNMATADLVELLLHTRVPPDRIVHWVDQAMLYTQLGPEKKPTDAAGEAAVAKSPRLLLGEHGIRTASALVAAYELSKQRDDVSDFEKILPGEGRCRIRSLIDSLSTNPNLVLIQQWRYLPSPAR